MERIRMILTLCLLLLPLLFTAAPAANAGPCAEELAKFCSSVRPGGGRLMNCLQEHGQELSAACREHQDLLQRKTRKAPPECRDDVERFCIEVRPVDRRIVRCLLQSEAGLSIECKLKLYEGK